MTIVENAKTWTEDVAPRVQRPNKEEDSEEVKQGKIDPSTVAVYFKAIGYDMLIVILLSTAVMQATSNLNGIGHEITALRMK